MKTRAAILVRQREPLVIDEVEVPPLSYGQVLVAVKVTRICGSQIGEIDGVKGPDRYLPHLLGHEAGGVVQEVGPEVTKVKPGDHVVLHWRPAAGLQAKGAQYRWAGQTVNAGPVTTFSELTVVSENRLTLIPAEISFDTAALLADTILTGFGVVTREARVQIGESVVVIGVGGIGLGVVLGAHLAGAYPIVGVDLYDHKLKNAAKFGMDYSINSGRQDFVEEVVQLLNGRRPEVVIDGTGSPDLIAEALRLVDQKGRCLLFGVMPSQQKLSLNTLQLHLGKTLTGSEGGQSRPTEDIPRYLRMLAAGRFSADAMISHRGPLENVNDLIRKMRQGEVIHAVLDL